MDVNEARRLKELERENRELKEMLAESLLKNRVLEAVCEKNCKPGPSAGGGTTCGGCRAVFSKTGLPVSATGPLNIPLSRPSADRCGTTGEKKTAGTFRGTSKIRRPPNRGLVASGGLAGW
jgi:hypothetical protein